MNNLIQWALNIAAKNPNIANNPRNAEMFRAIQSGDQQSGEQIARNLCQTYGVSEQQAIDQARRFFGV